MKVSAARIAGSSDASASSISLPAGNAGTSFSILLVPVAAGAEKAPPANGKTAGKRDPSAGRGETKERTRSPGASVLGSQRASESAALQQPTLSRSSVTAMVASVPNSDQQASLAIAAKGNGKVDSAASIDKPQVTSSIDSATAAGPVREASPGQSADGNVASVITDGHGSSLIPSVMILGTGTAGQPVRTDGRSSPSSVAAVSDDAAPRSTSAPEGQLGREPVGTRTQLPVSANFLAEFTHPTSSSTSGEVSEYAEGDLRDSSNFQAMQSSHSHKDSTEGHVTAVDRTEPAASPQHIEAARPILATNKVASNSSADPGNADIAPLMSTPDSQSRGSGQPRRDDSGSTPNSSASAQVERQVSENGQAAAPDLSQAVRMYAPGLGPAPEPETTSASSISPSAQMAMQQMTTAGDARALRNALRGDLRVGVQTEAFGRVTIRTIADGQQLSAQLSLEDGKQSASLTAHLPGVEQKLTTQYGLHASVRIDNGISADARGSMDNDGRGSESRSSYQQNGQNPERVLRDRLNPFTSAPRDVAGIASVNVSHVASSWPARLDITV